jgi:hypothetical protein
VRLYADVQDVAWWMHGVDRDTNEGECATTPLAHNVKDEPIKIGFGEVRGSSGCAEA